MRIAPAALLLCAYIAAAQQFPAIEAKNALDRPMKFPDGNTAVVVMGFTHASFNQTKVWAQHLSGPYNLWSIAVLEDVPRLVRGMATHGIKSNVPPDQRGHYLLVYKGEKELKDVAGFSTPDDAYILIVDKSGVVTWKFHGPFTDAALEQFKAVYPK